MNSLIESVNGWAEAAVRLGWPMLWQSSLLIGVVLGLDLLLRRKLRAAVRYGLWLVVLVKLLLPPSLALPTGAGWWLRSSKAPPPPRSAARMVVTYDTDPLPAVPPPVAPVHVTPPPPALSYAGWALLAAGGGTAMLLLWMLLRWAQVARDAARAQAAPPELGRLVPELPLAGRVRLIDRLQSPAVCGLFRPVILMPRALAEQLPPTQLRAVLLHELIHLRRGDVWVNCLQTLLQIVYWWHPLLWVANARIRRVREEAVDDAVMLALNEEAESYAPTLLEVAKLALHRPLATLGLVGILESRSSLRRRIERLVDFRPPRRAGLGFASVLGVIGFAAVAVPMAEAPAPTVGVGPASNASLPVDQSQLYIRTFKISTNTLIGALSLAKGPVGTNGLESVVPALMAHFAQAGVNLDPATNPGRTMFYTYGVGLLGVRATQQELDIIEDQIAKLNKTSLSSEGWGGGKAMNASLGRRIMMSKLEQIRFDSITFDRTPLMEVVRFLAEQANKRDQDKAGLAFLVTPEMGTNLITIQPPLRDVRLVDVLDAIVRATDRPIKYSIEDRAIVFLAKKPGLQAATGTTAVASSTNAVALDEKVKASSLVHDGKLLYELGKLDEAEAKFGQSRPRYAPLLPAPSNARKTLIGGNPGRKAIIDKLERIRLSELSFQGLPLTEVLRWLSDEARKRDPDKAGINFILQTDQPEETAPGFAVDPATGLPAPAASQEPVAALVISIPVPLRDLRLADALDAIIKVAPRPLKYTIEDYGIVLSARTVPEAKQLYIRTYKVDPNTLLDSLHISGGVDEKNRLRTIQEQVTAALRDQFAKAGADLDSVKNPGKAIFFNDRQGMLIIRGTLADLDVVEAAIGVLNSTPAQIHIRAQFIEITQDDTKAIGFDWYLGNMLLTTNAGAPAPGAAPFSGNLGSSLVSGAPPAAGTSPSATGILTDPQYRMLLKALQQRKGAELIAQAEVTTRSGQQAQCKVSQILSIVTGLKPQALTAPGISSTNEDDAALYEVSQQEMGPVLDIKPTVLSDGYTISLSLNASVTEFLGYEDAQTNTITAFVNGKSRKVKVPQASFRVAQVASQANVWDGQTLVLGNLISERGSSARKEAGKGSSPKRLLLVFVTPTLVDPAGNRIHSEDEMPFATNAIPAQAPR